MKQAEFMSIIGYNGEYAIVDKSLMKQHGKSDIDTLLKLGQYKMALAKAVYSDNKDEIDKIVAYYNEKTGKQFNYDKLLKVMGLYLSFKESLKLQYI